MNTNQNIIAIDISKDSLQIQFPHAQKNLPYTQANVHWRIKSVGKLPNPFFVFEATGGYEQLLKQSLHEAKLPLCLISPSRVRAFAKSEGIQAKTDPIDARLLYRFAQEKNLRPTPAPSAQQLQLAHLMDRRTQLSDQLSQEKNRLHKASATVDSSIKKMIHCIESEISQIETLIRRCVRAEATTKDLDRLFQSVDGVGEVTSWAILAYLPEINHFPRNTLVALAGVAPYNRDSGNTKGQRSIFGGRAKLRRILYMAALTAKRCNPVIKAYAEGLKKRDKPEKCILVAIMRKLIIHLKSLVKKSNLDLA